MSSAPELAIVMPVYNEEPSVGRVLTEWVDEISRRIPDAVFLVIDDGSKDGTLRVLKEFQREAGPRVEIRTRENRGHGQSCLEGYRMACDLSARFILQIDSDGQCDPRYFEEFWNQREAFDVIYGQRVQRDDGSHRAAAMLIFRTAILLLAGANCIDANVPYRLIRAEALRKRLALIPPDLFLVNVALAILLRKDKSIRHGRVPIRFRQRFAGVSSVNLKRLSVKAAELFSFLRTVKSA